MRKYYKYKSPSVGYRELNFMELSNTPSIDTNITCNSNLKMILDFVPREVNGEVILGQNVNGDSVDYRFFNYNSNIYFDMGSARINGSSCTVGTRYKFEFGNYYVKNYGESSNLISGATQSYSNSNTIKIQAAITFYGLQIYNNDMLVGDFIPCKRMNDNVIGWYNKVTNEFTTIISGSIDGGYYIIEESTSSDYDFYKDIPSTILKNTDIYYNSLKVNPNELKTINLPTGQYRIEMYGGGGCATTSTTPDIPYGGGSSAGFKGVINLQAGTYTVEVGGGRVNSGQMGGTPPTYWDTKLILNETTLINAGAGEDGIWRNRYGYGGTLTIDNSVDIVSSEIRSNGNNGTNGGYGTVWRPVGGMSLYDGTSYGYGAGGSANEGGTMNGADGYFYLERLDGNIGYNTVYVAKLYEKITRYYYKHVITEQEFIRPNLTSNGTLGEDTFACASSSFPWNNTGLCYQMFNGVDGDSNGNSTAWTGGGWIKWYNPNPLKVTNVICAAGYSGDWVDVTFRGSNDGTNWTDVAYFNHGVRTACPVNSTEFYTYWMMYNNSGFGHDGSGYGGGISEVHITAIEKVESIEEVLNPQFIERKYYKYTYIDADSPIFTSNTETDGVSIITGGSNYAITGTNSGTSINTNQIVTFDVGESSGGINSIGFIGVVVGGSYPGAVMTNVQCSEDNENWITISNSFGGRGDYLTNPLVISSPNNYRYIRFTSGVDDNRYSYGGMYMVTINYKKRGYEESTEQDYDFYKDIYNYDFYKDIKTYKIKKY